MSFTTGVPIAQPALAISELVAYKRTTVRRHPRRGPPGVHDSHIGGPLMWPAGEPWPLCAGHGRDAGREPLVAVAQFTAADFPEIHFPEGTDLVQVLWCPEWDDQPHPEGWGPVCRLEWRRAADVADVLAVQPDPGDHWDRDYDMVPRACELHPERLEEYPWYQELPADLQMRVEAWLDDE